MSKDDLGGMNVFVYNLSEGTVDESPDLNSTKFCVEDNVGESVHIHYRNLRVELTVKEFVTFADNIKNSLEEI